MTTREKPKRGKADHVIMLDGGGIRCTHCATTYQLFPNGAAQPIWAVTALTDAFIAQHRKCPKPEGTHCDFCTGLHESEQHINETTTTALDWLHCGDTGLSSKALWHHFMTSWSSGKHPHEPGDFGRCSRLLGAPWAKGWRERISEMGEYSPEWRALAGAWDELERLYREELPSGSAPRLYARMRELIDGEH